MADSSNPGRRILLGMYSLAFAVLVGFDIRPASAQVLDGSPAAMRAEAAAEAFDGARARALQFEAMAQGQAPGRLFITCSDSRLVPSLITGTGPGELFVIRNAGNIVPPYDARPEGVAATIEYAVAVLEVPTIVVCGYTRCGAMKAAVDPAGLETVPNIRNWIKFAEAARLAVEELHPHLGPVARWIELVKQNVLQQLTNLNTHPWVAARTASGRLQLEGWIYELDSGEVRRLPLP